MTRQVGAGPLWQAFVSSKRGGFLNSALGGSHSQHRLCSLLSYANLLVQNLASYPKCESIPILRNVTTPCSYTPTLDRFPEVGLNAASGHHFA